MQGCKVCSSSVSVWQLKTSYARLSLCNLSIVNDDFTLKQFSCQYSSKGLCEIRSTTGIELHITSRIVRTQDATIVLTMSFRFFSNICSQYQVTPDTIFSYASLVGIQLSSKVYSKLWSIVIRSTIDMLAFSQH